MRFFALILLAFAACSGIPENSEIAKYKGETFDWNVRVEILWMPEGSFETCQWRRMWVEPKPKLHDGGLSDHFVAFDYNCDGQWDQIRATRGQLSYKGKRSWMVHQDIDHALGIVVPIGDQGRTR